MYEGPNSDMRQCLSGKLLKT